MKKYIPLICALLLFASCKKKNIVEKKLLYGHWEYTKAERVRTFGSNENLIDQYKDIEIFIEYDKNFTWTEGTSEWYGTIEHSSGSNSESNDPCDTHDDLIFHFDDGSTEVWHEFSARKNKNKIIHCMDNLHFELEKKIENTRRRNGDAVVDPNNNNGKG